MKLLILVNVLFLISCSTGNSSRIEQSLESDIDTIDNHKIELSNQKKLSTQLEIDNIQAQIFMMESQIQAAESRKLHHQDIFSNNGHLNPMINMIDAEIGGYRAQIMSLEMRKKSLSSELLSF